MKTCAKVESEVVIRIKVETEVNMSVEEFNALTIDEQELEIRDCTDWESQTRWRENDLWKDCFVAADIEDVYTVDTGTGLPPLESEPYD